MAVLSLEVDRIKNSLTFVGGVEGGNVPAVTLYKKIGFEEKKSITAYIWEKGNTADDQKRQ